MLVSSWINSRVVEWTIRPMVWEQVEKKTGITGRSMGSLRRGHVRPASLPFCFLIDWPIQGLLWPGHDWFLPCVWWAGGWAVMESSFVLTAGLSWIPMFGPWPPFVHFSKMWFWGANRKPGALWEGIWKHPIDSQSWLCSLLRIFYFGYRAETVEQESQNFERKVESQAVQVWIPALHLTNFRSAAS